MSALPTPQLDLNALRLDDARALLEHGGDSALLPSPTAQPLAYLQAMIDALCDLSLRDPLTGLANRRHFRSALERSIDVVARSGESALLLMLDIDHFKRINDTYGHIAGDQVLQAVGRCLAGCVRPMDTLARYGGEEFGVVLPNCPASFGPTIAERIRQTIQAMRVQVTPLVSVRVTVSIGAAFAPEWVRSTAELWIERADVQLYQAKAAGRNAVCFDQQAVISVSAEEKSLLFGHLSSAEPAWIATAQAAGGVAAGQDRSKVKA